MTQRRHFANKLNLLISGRKDRLSVNIWGHKITDFCLTTHDNAVLKLASWQLSKAILLHGSHISKRWWRERIDWANAGLFNEVFNDVNMWTRWRAIFRRHALLLPEEFWKVENYRVISCMAAVASIKNIYLKLWLWMPLFCFWKCDVFLTFIKTKRHFKCLFTFYDTNRADACRVVEQLRHTHKVQHIFRVEKPNRLLYANIFKLDNPEWQ